jgi:DNA-binding transcriptional MerR regulator
VGRRTGPPRTYRYGRVDSLCDGAQSAARYRRAVAPETGTSLHRIGEVAERTGLSLRTMRYYEEVGLVVPSTRTEGGFRLYSDEDVERLRLVKYMKPLGLTVQQMVELMDARDRMADPATSAADFDAACAVVEALAAESAERVEKLRVQLERAEGFPERLDEELRRFRRERSA